MRASEPNHRQLGGGGGWCAFAALFFGCVFWSALLVVLCLRVCVFVFLVLLCFCVFVLLCCCVLLCVVLRQVDTLQADKVDRWTEGRDKLAYLCSAAEVEKVVNHYHLQQHQQQKQL